jgi:fructose-specific phosphotransferase system IIC component
MLVVGGGIAAVSMFIFIAGVSQMLPFIIIGCVLALAGFVYAAAAWIRSGSQGGGQRQSGGIEERLHRLNRLRAESLITEEEYGLRRREILRDL